MQVMILTLVLILLTGIASLHFPQIPAVKVRKAASLQSKASRAAEIQAEIDEASKPLMDKEFVERTVASWKRPMPLEYVSQPLVLVGPSGVGKGRLVKSILQDWEKYFHKVVTHTTRKPRPNEKDGVDYHYVSTDQFLSYDTSFFLEHASVHNNLYGVSKDAWIEATEQKKIPLLEIDIQGAKTVRKLADSLNIQPKYVFVSPKNLKMLRERLLSRSTETEEEIELRIRNAQSELDEVRKNPALFDHILVNDDFELTSNAFFRLSRDEYKWLPSPAKLQMLKRRAAKVRKLQEELLALEKEEEEEGE